MIARLRAARRRRRAAAIGRTLRALPPALRPLALAVLRGRGR